MLERWDFEGRVRFLTPEEGGLQVRPRMGYFPSLTYPDYQDKTHFIARPIAAFRDDGTHYEEGETFEATVTMRFLFLSRDLYERVHRHRLIPGLRFELTEGFRVVANGEAIALNGP